MIDSITQAIESQAVHTAEVVGYATVAIAVFEHYTGVGPKNLKGKWQLVPALVLTISGLFAFALDAGLSLWLAAVVAVVNGSLAGYGANVLHRGAQFAGGKRRRLDKSATASDNERMNKTLFSLIVLVALISVGCAGSFESARLAGLPPTMKASPPSARCQQLDADHYTWDAVSKGAAVFAGAEGLGQIPVRDESKHAQEIRMGLAVGTAVAATTAVVAATISDGLGESWARECSTPALVAPVTLAQRSPEATASGPCCLSGGVYLPGQANETSPVDPTCRPCPEPL